MQPFFSPYQTASARIPSPANHSVSFPLKIAHSMHTGPIRLCYLLPKPSESINGCSEQTPINTAPLHKRWTYTDSERDGRFYDIFGYIRLRVPFLSSEQGITEAVCYSRRIPVCGRSGYRSATIPR